MLAFNGLSQTGSTHMGIDLGCREICVPEHGLYGAKIGSALEQIRRKRVAQNMG
jgi:hypothetical protein